MFPLGRGGRPLCSPGHVYQEQENVGRDSLALDWDATVQNAPCVEKEEVRRSPKEHISIRDR